MSWRYCGYATRNVTCILDILSLCNKKGHVYRPTRELLRYVTRQFVLHTKPSTFYDSSELNQLNYLRQFPHSSALMFLFQLHFQAKILPCLSRLQHSFRNSSLHIAQCRFPFKYITNRHMSRTQRFKSLLHQDIVCSVLVHTFTHYISERQMDSKLLKTVLCITWPKLTQILINQDH